MGYDLERPSGLSLDASARRQAKRHRRQRYRRRRARRLKLYLEQGGLCYWCRRPLWLTDLGQQGLANQQGTIEHVLPRCRGGKDCWANLALACKRCNTAKGGELLHPVTGEPLFADLPGLLESLGRDLDRDLDPDEDESSHTHPSTE